MTEILLADDHPLFRDALRGAARLALPDAAIVEADSVQTLLERLEAHPQADLLLLDLGMPGANGFSTLVHIRGSRPGLPIVVVSARDDVATIQRAMALGAAGFVPKSADAGVLAQALRRVMDGDTWVPEGIPARPVAASDEERELARRVAELTPQQFRVLGMVCAGLLNKQIAYDLGVTEATVKAHMTAILRKLGVHTRTQAVMAAARLALDPAGVRPPPEGVD